MLQIAIRNEPHGEGAAVAQLAFGRDLATQEPAQFADDRQPQAAARVFPRHGVAAGEHRLALAEFLEDGGLVFLGDPLTLPILAAIVIATAGVVLMSFKPGAKVAVLFAADDVGVIENH